MRVLTGVVAVGLLVLGLFGMVLHRRNGRLPRWHNISILVASLALFASLVAFQIIR